MLHAMHHIVCMACQIATGWGCGYLLSVPLRVVFFTRMRVVFFTRMQVVFLTRMRVVFFTRMRVVFFTRMRVVLTLS